MRKFGLILAAAGLLVVIIFVWWMASRPERGTTGSVSTNFRLFGPDDKIVVDGFDDPKVQGVACHISRAQTGGVKGGLGLAEDTSDASIAQPQPTSRGNSSAPTAPSSGTKRIALNTGKFVIILYPDRPPLRVDDVIHQNERSADKDRQRIVARVAGLQAA